MAYPASKWDLVPVYGVFMTAPGDTPVQGNVQFKLSQRVTRTDGRTIYPDGARVQVGIGKADDQDANVRAAVRSAWRTADEAAGGESFDGSAWDIWWDTKVLPAAIFTGFPASDDPDISQRDWTVTVTEALTGANGRVYAIQPLLSHLEAPIPGINLGAVEVPPGAPTSPAPVYAKGIAGGVAALDADGDVVDASGAKLAAGEGAKGDKGDPGIPGAPGTPGVAGTNATITGATATNLAAGATPTVTVGGSTSARTFAFGIPVGAAGADGAPGAKGEKGDSGAAGAKGDKGDKGDQGIQGVPGSTTIGGIPGLQAELDTLSSRTQIVVVATEGDIPNPVPVGTVYAVITS